MYKASIIKWKKKSKILKLLLNVLYENNGNVLRQLWKLYWKWKFKRQKTKQTRLMLLLNGTISDNKNQLLLKVKRSIILIIFQMISLKWIKSLTSFYWLETNLCQIFFSNCQDLLIVLVDHLLNIVKKLKSLEEQIIQNISIEMN